MTGAQAHDGEGLPSVFLPPVVHAATVAVLVVDVVRGEVTYANELARELVPESVSLPVSVDDWSAAAELADVSGSELPEAGAATPSRPAESLLRVAQGRPVTGEAVTAARGTSATAPREVLWVLGLPLTGAPDPFSGLALVTFLPARNAQLVAGVQQAAASLRDRAVLATAVSFTITDPRQPDNPLVWVNPAFEATTGYSAEEVTGRNCRFLQGPDTDRAVVAQLREALRTEQPVTATLLNYRKDGTPFWNELSISPVRDQGGTVTHFVGVQADVTARVQTQRSRDDALALAARSAERLALLADFTSRMALSQIPAQAVNLLHSVLVPRVGTVAMTMLIDEQGRRSRPTITDLRSGDPQIADAIGELRDRLADELVEDGPILRVLSGSDGYRVVTELGQPADGEPARGVRRLLTERLGLTSMVVVPLRARHGILGVLVVGIDGSRLPFSAEDLTLARDLATRAGLMLENTQLYARQQQVAATFQRSLLPQLPRLTGIEVAARYIPSSDEAAVGGDWYDVFALRDGGVGFVVGDVMGHNYDSAAHMGKLSTIVRAYAYPGSAPSTVLTAVDELLGDSAGTLDVLATCLLGTLHLHSGGATLRYASAGHPASLLRLPDGSVERIDSGRGPMIGIAGLSRLSTRPADEVRELPAGSMLVSFTDGLIDAHSADGDIDVGLARLAELTQALPVGAPPRAVVQALTAAAGQAKDDVAVVALRIE